MIKFFKEKVLPQTITKKEETDTGMAMVLISLLLGYFTKNTLFYQLAIPLLVINMAFTKFYYPFAIIWLGLTNLLGIVVSRVLISVVYIVILLPMGLIRQAMGKDSLKLNGFKKDTKSVMLVRNHEFTTKDITNPF